MCGAPTDGAIENTDHQRLLCSRCLDAGLEAIKDQLRGTVDGDVKERLTAFVAQLGDVDVEVTDLVVRELLRLLPIRLGQSAVAGIGARRKGVSDAGLRPSARYTRHPAVSRLHPKRDDRGLLHGREHRPAAFPRPHRHILDRPPLTPLHARLATQA